MLLGEFERELLALLMGTRAMTLSSKFINQVVTQKEMGGYFKIHDSSVSRIVAASKKQDNENERPSPNGIDYIVRRNNLLRQ